MRSPCHLPAMDEYRPILYLGLFKSPVQRSCKLVRVEDADFATADTKAQVEMSEPGH